MTDLTACANLNDYAKRALSLMDLTTLNDDDTDDKVIALCHQAKSPAGNTAAICIYPRFIPIARKTLREQGTPEIRIATVTTSHMAMMILLLHWQKPVLPLPMVLMKWMWFSLTAP